MTSYTTLLVSILVILMIHPSAISMVIIRTAVSRSSILSSTDGYVLKGNVIHYQRTHNILACAQLCLVRSNCMSFNFENRKNGMCELNKETADVGRITDKTTLFRKRGYSFHQLLNISAAVSQDLEISREHQYVFTTLNSRGSTGPTSTSGYIGTLLEGKVNLSNGIQIWSVPVTGNYVIEVSGASGANGTDVNESSWRIGGLGARLRGYFKFHKGSQLKILVGQEGDRTTDFAERPGGGGGGSFVIYLNDTPLIIAGGGGGGGTPIEQYKDGEPGQATEKGTRCGGTGGTGGRPCNVLSGGGAGLNGNGSGGGVVKPSLSFINGGTGGSSPTSIGGFGGGGCGVKSGGGGDGYSGGGVEGNTTGDVAGGGGSYNIGANKQNLTGVNKGNGRVIITLEN